MSQDEQRIYFSIGRAIVVKCFLRIPHKQSQEKALVSLARTVHDGNAPSTMEEKTGLQRLTF